jgi:CDP-2,3-bis-(O-geranylgeranyl)-sn-glycerol synthase
MDYIGPFLYILPAYIANGAPVLFGGGRPIDGGRKMADGRRVLGDSKTIRGLASGITAGMLTGVILSTAVPGAFLPQFPFWTKMAIALLLSLGTMLGDLAGSFVKRRIGMAAGEPFFLLEQLLFFVAALAFSLAVYLPDLAEVLYLFAVTFALHVLTNIVAHRLKLKRVPW